MAKRVRGVSQAADELGVSASWIRKAIASGIISPTRRGNKPNGRFAITDGDLTTLRAYQAQREAVSEKGDTEGAGASQKQSMGLSRVTELEADRTNLLAQVAWARAIAREQQKTLDYERERTEKLAAELEVQRARVEALKALTTVDRLMGRHKAI